jgi:hypothetical protein
LRISTADWVSSVSCMSSAIFIHAVCQRMDTNYSFVVREIILYLPKLD